MAKSSLVGSQGARYKSKGSGNGPAGIARGLSKKSAVLASGSIRVRSKSGASLASHPTNQPH